MFTIKFLDAGREVQTIKVQLPDCIIAKQSASGKKLSKLPTPLVSGKLVLSDETNKLKAAIFIRGLMKKTTKFTPVYEAYKPNSKS